MLLARVGANRGIIKGVRVKTEARVKATLYAIIAENLGISLENAIPRFKGPWHGTPMLQLQGKRPYSQKLPLPI